MNGKIKLGLLSFAAGLAVWLNAVAVQSRHDTQYKPPEIPIQPQEQPISQDYATMRYHIAGKEINLSAPAQIVLGLVVAGGSLRYMWRPLSEPERPYKIQKD